jgi:hypothetical protein
MVVGANCVRPSNGVRSLRAIVESKRIDQSRQRRGLLPATWIVQKEPRKRRTPILQHADQCSAREVFRHPIFRDLGNACPVERRLDHQVEFIQEQ